MMVGWLNKIFNVKPNLSTYENKINYLLKHFSINMYSSDMLLLEGRFIDRTIEESIINFKQILDIDITINPVPYRQITEAALYVKGYGEWCVTRDDLMYTDTISVLKEWLRLSLRIIRTYNIGNNNMSNLTFYNNCRSIRPYILNIQYIVDDLITELTGV